MFATALRSSPLLEREAAAHSGAARKEGSSPAGEPASPGCAAGPRVKAHARIRINEYIRQLPQPPTSERRASADDKVLSAAGPDSSRYLVRVLSAPRSACHAQHTHLHDHLAHICIALLS